MRSPHIHNIYYVSKKFFANVPNLIQLKINNGPFMGSKADTSCPVIVTFFPFLCVSLSLDGNPRQL